MAGQFDHYLGELQPGDKGWLPLDENGTPNGPATKQPPPAPNALACAVMANSTEAVQNEGEDALVTSTGAPITNSMISNIDKRPPGWEAPQPPAITSLTPTTAAIGSEDFDLVVAGTGFNSSSTIHFAGHEEPTTHNPDGTLSTGVKPSLWNDPVTVQCSVINEGVSSNSVDFEFTAPASRKQSRNNR